MPYKRPYTPEATRHRSEAHKRWRIKHREEYNRQRRERHAQSPVVIISEEKRERFNAAVRRSYAKNKEKNRAKKRADYQKNKVWLYVRNARRAIADAEALRPRPAACEACGNTQRRIEFDHCHRCGSFRGWLCSHCNKALGLAKDDPEVLRKLLAYLLREGCS
jgi:predicted Zn-ribbon and HTH transcriptional regulator